MRKATIILIAFALMGLNAIGQITFQKTFIGLYSGAAGVSAIQTFDGGYCILGMMSDTTSVQTAYGYATLIKLNANGDTLWTGTYNVDTVNFGYQPFSFTQTTNGDFVIVGTNWCNNGQNITCIKVSSSGVFLWGKYIGGGDAQSCSGPCGCANPYGVFPNSIVQANDGGFVICDYDIDAQNGDDARIIKTDSSGNFLWANSYDIWGWEDGWFNCLQKTNDGGFIAIGNLGLQTIGGEYLVKINNNGDTLFCKVYDSAATIGNWVSATNDGGYIIAGAGYNSFDVIKTDNVGHCLWSKSYYAGSQDNQATCVKQTTDGGYIIAGYTNSTGFGGYDYYLIKTDSTGNVLWSKVYGDSLDERITTVQQTTDGGFLICGTKDNSSGNANYCYIIKTDSHGNSGCHELNVVTTDTIRSSPDSIAGIFGSYPYNSGLITTFLGRGCIATDICFTTETNEISITNSLSLYPNPTTSLLTISLPDKNIKSCSINLYDMLGQLIIENGELRMEKDAQQLSTLIPTSSGQLSIDLSNLSQGIYFLEVLMDGEKVVRKVVKMN